MVMPIQSLMNMEMALYGGSGLSTNAPSFYNNYMGRAYGDSTANSVFNYGYNPSFYGNPYNTTAFGQQTGQAQSTQTAFEGLNSSDIKNLQNSYVRDMEPSGSLLGTAAGAVGFAVVTKPRLWAHPITTFSSLSKINESGLFSSLKTDGSFLNTLWKDSTTNGIVRDAYGTAHKATQNANKAFGLFHRKYSEAELNKINEIMKAAIDSGDKTKIANATARIDQAYKSTNKITNFWNNKVRGKSTQSVMDVLEGVHETPDTAKKIADAAAKISSGTPKTYWETVKAGGGLKGGIFMFGLEMIMSIGKIRTAFSKDNKTGAKQIGQSTVKAVGNAAGWTLGEALGTWGCAKALAAAGTIVAPGVGTAIGAVVGMVGGMVGCWLAGKITKKIVGEDVANKVEAEKLAQTQEGQVQLLQAAVQKVQKGEADAATTQTVKKLLNAYA